MKIERRKSRVKKKKIRDRVEKRRGKVRDKDRVCKEAEKRLREEHEK